MIGKSNDSGAELKDSLTTLLAEIETCRICADMLPLGPRPVVQISSTARLLIAGQAPGTRVHETGRPFNDASGERLRAWLDLSEDEFYDSRKVAILPMGFCYPGRLPGGGDAPPRPECAALWRQRLLEHLPNLRLTLLVGGYAQSYILGPGTVTDRVERFRSYLPSYFPLPHPSWRTLAWAKKYPWFQAEVLPELRVTIRRALH